MCGSRKRNTGKENVRGVEGNHRVKENGNEQE